MDKRRNKVDWTDLLPEMLDAILDKLFHNSDFVRFGAVCKSWRSVALQQKKKRRANISKQSPVRLVWCLSGDLDDNLETYKKYYPTGYFKPKSHLRLYNVGEDKSYRLNLLKLLAGPEEDVIDDDVEVKILGSSCGWLALQTKDISEPIRFCNPFNRKCMKVPPVPEDYECKRFIVSPDSLVMAAYLHPLRLAVIAAGEISWTVGNIVVEEEGTSPLPYADIMFHKGLLYAVDCYYRLLVIDYTSYRSSHFPAIPVMSKQRLDFDITIKTAPGLTNLAESSSGDLVITQEDYDLLGYETYKLQNYEKENTNSPLQLQKGEEEEEVTWVKVSKFKRNETVSTDFPDTIINPFGTCFCIKDCSPDWLVWDARKSLDEGFNDTDKDCIHPLEWLSPQLY